MTLAELMENLGGKLVQGTRRHSLRSEFVGAGRSLRTGIR